MKKEMDVNGSWLNDWLPRFSDKLFNWLIFKGADGEGDGGGEEGDAARRPLTRRLHSGLFPNIKTVFQIRMIRMFLASRIRIRIRNYLYRSGSGFVSVRQQGKKLR